MTAPDDYIHSLAAPTRAAAQSLLAVSDQAMDAMLVALSEAIVASAQTILEANARDVAGANDKGLTDALIDRLRLNEARVKAIAASVKDIAALPHPAGKTLETYERPNGLIIEKTSVPIGVLGMIYESRPNVTIDAAALCLKSRNAVILRGGSEAFHTNQALHKIVADMLAAHDMDKNAVTFIPDTDRALVGAMLAAPNVIDVMIPRGGKGLTSRVMAEAKMPVFAHLDGNCHIYIHESARPDMALEIVKNAKLRRAGICGAAESLLIDTHYNGAAEIIAMLIGEGVTIMGDTWAQSVDPAVKAATQEDWGTEYLDKKISVKRINGVEEAIAHINKYGSHHTDAIIAEDTGAVARFTRDVDSAIVVHNASTQFADGGEFGFGAEIGIGTGKLHARGPVGLAQLCTFKYVVRGKGQIRP